LSCSAHKVGTQCLGGYKHNLILNVVLGVFVLRERLTVAQWTRWRSQDRR